MCSYDYDNLRFCKVASKLQFSVSLNEIRCARHTSNGGRALLEEYGFDNTKPAFCRRKTLHIFCNYSALGNITIVYEGQCLYRSVY